MKKIINGKIYDTAKASEKARFANIDAVRDHHRYVETLYLKKTGEYFLHGAGGPRTQYATSCGNNTWSEGEAIMPLSYEAARAWAEKHLSGDEYESIFGAVVETEGKEVVTLYLPSALLARIRREAQEAGKGISELIAERMA